MTARRQRLTILAATTAALLSAAVFARQDAPTTAPTTATAPVASGDWFSASKVAKKAGGPETEAEIFARLYPALAAQDRAIRAATPRLLFDGMVSRGKPLMKLPLLIGISETFTDASNRNYGASKPLNPWLLVPDERRVRIGAVTARQNAASVFLDVELLPLDPRVASPADIDRSIAVISRMVGWARAQDPNLRLFFYSAFPVPDAYLGANRARAATTMPGGANNWWKANVAKFAAEHDRWRDANAKLAKLASLFDATCPSLYINPVDELTETTTAIPGYVRETVNESRRYGKPVYPFVWFRLWNTTTPVPLKLWTTFMREVLTWADGAVLWDGIWPWDNRLALRVRIAMVIAERKGDISDAEIYDLIKADFPGDTELLVLRGDPATTQPASTQPAAEPAKQQTR